MRTRHRIPSVFNLSMVDVLCCALGCVILLWLLNLREARVKAAQAGRSDETVATLRQSLAVAEAEARSTADLLKKTQADRDAELARAIRLEKDTSGLKAEKASSTATLAQRMKDIAALESQLRERNADAAASGRRADDLSAKLKDA